MVYVQSKDGQPLMPTADHRKVRFLLEAGKARVVSRTPFTIRLNVTTNTYKQPVTLGVDVGSKHVGMSATTEAKELYASETELRDDVSAKLSARREFRRARRNRKTRYRKPRFDNRVRSKHKGWLAPSLEQKINSHLQIIRNVCKILPVNEIVVEAASFDMQKIKNPDIKGEEYQRGEQLGFWNVREYVLWRDSHECQCCHGKRKDKVLNVHHIISRKTGGDAPGNLVTLCETCHKAYHRGEINLPEGATKPKPMRDAAFMGIMRWEVYNRLKAEHPDVRMTYGYITKNTRIRHGLEKSHTTDARCVSGHPDAEPCDEYFYQKCVRRHNRQLHKATINKRGVRKANQAAKYVYGYQLFDKVRYRGQECFIWGRRMRGYFTLKTLNSTMIVDGTSYKKIILLEKAESILKERRGAPPMFENTGVRA